MMEVYVDSIAWISASCDSGLNLNSCGSQQNSLRLGLSYIDDEN